MADLYAKPSDFIDTGYNPEQQQAGGVNREVDEYLNSLPLEERDAARQRLMAPPTGEEIAMMVDQDENYIPTLEQFGEIEKWHKTKEVGIFDGLGTAAEMVFNEFGAAVSSAADKPLDTATKLPATVLEAFMQGTRAMYGMAAQSQNPDSAFFRVKDFLNGTGTVEERYNQYLEALDFNRKSKRLMEGRETLVMDKDLINPEVTQAMSYIADPTLFVPFAKVASAGARAVGMGEKLTLAAGRATAIKNKIIGGAIKWGAGQPLEFLGGAVRNTIDFGLEKAGDVFETATGMGAREFAQTARMSGLGVSAAGVAGHSIPYANAISDAYFTASAGRGLGEALTAVGETMQKSPFDRGINSWAREALEQANKSGTPLSKQAQGLLKALDAVDPMFAYSYAMAEGAAQGMAIGGTLGYLSAGEEGLYQGMGAGLALGTMGAGAGKVVSDVTGGTGVARRAVQAKMVIEGKKVTDPETAATLQAIQKAAEIRGKDVDLINGIIAGIDKIAPDTVLHGLTPEQFKIEAERQGYNPDTGKFAETQGFVNLSEFGDNREMRGRTTAFLRLLGGSFAGDPDKLVRLSKDTRFQTQLNERIKTQFNRLSQFEKDFVVRELKRQKGLIDSGQKKATDFRADYEAVAWGESWTDAILKKYNNDREGAKRDIKDILRDETKNGKLTRRGEVLKDRLRAEGFLSRNGDILSERNLHNADMTRLDFISNKGAVVSRKADGKTHLYLNLSRFGDETFPHELFHAIFRDSPLKNHFIDSLNGRVLGVRDNNGNLIKEPEVPAGEIRKFIKKYIDATTYDKNAEFDPVKAKEKYDAVEAGLKEYEQTGDVKKISEETRDLVENYVEEFGAYYFSQWIMGKNRNYLFYGGELKGIAGIIDSVKENWLDFWQSKISKTNPSFDFSNGINAAFERGGSFGRVSAIDFWMRDMVRANANSLRGAFNPDIMSAENARQFYRSNGIRNLADPDGRAYNANRQRAESRRIGREAFKILKGLDPNLRTTKTVLDADGKEVITGRFSEAELDALVKAGIVPRAWADKVTQGYAMVDGTIPNVASFGYLGRTEQIGDYSWPRKTGKDVAFKNRKAIVFDVETKVRADGTFYTLFHTLDKAVIEQRAGHLWQDINYRNLWDGDRGAMEADFFLYLANASKPSTDSTKVDSATLLDKGDGLGAERRNVLHQMAGMSLLQGDSYKYKPIAEIPEGIRQSVTTFNVDGMTTIRIDKSERYNVDMNNAHKFIRENWQPDDMKQEKTPNGVAMTHASGFKFLKTDDGKVSAYTSAGRNIGKFSSIKEAIKAGKDFFNSVHKQYDKIEESVRKNIDTERKNFQILEPHERQAAIDSGDVFSVQKVKDFVGNRRLIRQTKEEFTIDRFEKDIKNNPEKLFAVFHNELREDLNYLLKLDSINEEINKLTKQLADGVKVDDEVFINQDLFRLRVEFDNVSDKIKNIYQAKRFSRLLEDIRTVQAVGGRVPTPMDVLVNQNKIDLSIQGADEVLNQFKTELLSTLDILIKGNLQRGGDVDFINALYGKEYNQNFQTGVPFVTLGTHGTKFIEMMMAREILQEKLGSRYSIESSQSGGFFAGGQHTSSTYADMPPANARDALERMALPKTAKEIYDASPEIKDEWNVVRHAELPRLLEDLLTIYFNGKDEDGFYTGINGNKITEPTLTKIILNDVLGFYRDLTYVTPKERSEVIRQIIENSVFDPDKGAPLLNLELVGNGIQDYHGYIDFVKSKLNNATPLEALSAKLPFGMFRRLAERLISDANDRALYSDYQVGILGSIGKELSEKEDSAGRKAMRSAMAFSSAYKEMFHLRKMYGNNKDLINVDNNSYYHKLIDWKSDHYFKLINEVSSIGTKLGVPMPTKDVQMQIRSLFRMDNPLVIEGRKDYKEYYLKDKIRPAIAAGHDGIVFREMRDGGNYDNIYIVFKEKLKDNQLTIDTSFDDVAVPRGNDESGEKVRYGTELGLAFQPDEADVGQPKGKINIPMDRAYALFKKEYEESTGTSWSFDKFQSRARNWDFYGDENGFIAVRPQRSGFVKLVGMAGDNKSKLRAFQQLSEQGMPIWGMVSKEIKDIAVKRGMREPNLIERTALRQFIKPETLGDAEIVNYTKDGGVILRYPDVGEVTKYMIGTPEYYQKLRGMGVDAVKDKLGIKFQPAEGEQGGRTYTEKQMAEEFIGRYVSENKGIDKGLKLYYGKVPAGGGRMGLTLRDKKGEVVANASWMKFGEIVDDLDVKVDPKHQGKGYGNLMYSEVVERMRATGIETVQGFIIDEKQRPVKIRQRIIDKENARVGSKKRTEMVEQVDEDSGIWESGLEKQAWYQPDDKDKAPVNWVKWTSGKEGYNMDVIWMKPSRFLNLAYPFLGDYKNKEGRPNIESLKKKMQSGSEMDRIYLMVDLKKGTKSFKVLGHEGRHRATAAMELYGDDKLIPVEIDYDREHLKTINRGDYDYKLPEDKKQAGSISRMVKEDKPMWNEKGTAKFQPDELIQHGFEKSDLNEKLLKSGHIVLGFDERSLAGKAVVINNPDMMMTGELKTKEGKTLIEGEGGLNFVSKFADIWANSNQAKAETTAKKLRKAQEENGGVAFLALSRGDLTKALTSHTGSKGAMAILEYFVDQGYISLEEFRNALKDSGRKYGIEFNATKSAKDIHTEIAEKFFGVADSSFEARGSFVEDVITHLAENGKSGHRNIDKIRTALGSERLGKKISFGSTGIREAIGLMLSDKRANVDPSHIYAYIEVTGNISVEKTENGHKSYPYHIVQRDENGNKIRPRMLIPDKTNYVTDVMLDANKQEVPRIMTGKAGRTMSGSVKLGSNQVGEAYGYVKPAEKIPEGKQRLAWQPTEYTDFKTEQSPMGRIMKNAKGYSIMLINNKYRVYNPAKAIIGVYSNEDEAKRRVLRDAPKR